MAYKVIILYQLYMPSYFLGTFTEYPYLEHQKVQGKYKTYTETAQTFASEITENEVYAFLQKCLVMLPENCAQVMNLYLSGYEMEEIAGQLNLSLQTVYNTKSMAIRLLKKKFGKTNFINLLFCFLCKVNATSPTR